MYTTIQYNVIDNTDDDDNVDDLDNSKTNSSNNQLWIVYIITSYFHTGLKSYTNILTHLEILQATSGV